MPPALTTGGWPRAAGRCPRWNRVSCGLVIDGLFGIGLNRPLGADWQALVDTVNRWGAPVLALDVPSGVDADTGVALGRPIQARWTLSFIAGAGLELPGSGAGAIGERHLDTLDGHAVRGGRRLSPIRRIMTRRQSDGPSRRA